jgi:acyl-CoA synthetase (NDP forming)
VEEVSSMNPIIAKAIERKRRSLLEPEAKRLCSEWGIPIPKFDVSKTKEEAARLAHKIGYPVVLKVVQEGILHKADVGGVLTNLGTGMDVERGFGTIIRNVKSKKPESRIEGVLVEKMMPNTLEVIVGGLRDE